MWILISITLAALFWLLSITLNSAAAESSFLSYHWLHILALALSTLSVVQILRFLFGMVLQQSNGGGSKAMSDLLRAVMSVALYLVAGVLFLRYGLDLDVSNVVMTSTALSVILGLALQPLLGHLFAGVSIELERPLRVGDYVRRDKLEGRVVSLNWRTVRLRTSQRSFIVMPNSEFTSNTIEVIPADQPYRHEVPFSVDASTPPSVVIRICMQVLRSQLKGVCTAPEPSVLLLSNDAENGTLNYTARFFTLNFLSRRDPSSDFLERFWYALSREELWYPSWNPYAVTESTPQLGFDAGLQQALLACGRHQHYARHERIDSSMIALVMQGTLQMKSPPDQQRDSAALKALLVQLSERRGIQGPSRLTQEQRTALTDDAKLVLGPLAHLLCESIAALTDDPFLAYHALAHSSIDQTHREKLLDKAPAFPMLPLRKGDWLGWTKALGIAAQADVRAGNEGCKLFVWTQSDLRNALASIASGELKELVEQIQTSADGGEKLTLEGLENWICAD